MKAIPYLITLILAGALSTTQAETLLEANNRAKIEAPWGPLERIETPSPSQYVPWPAADFKFLEELGVKMSKTKELVSPNLHQFWETFGNVKSDGGETNKLGITIEAGTMTLECEGTGQGTPAVSPLDVPGKEFYFFRKVSEDEFELKAFNNAVYNSVYNARSGIWRTATRTDGINANAFTPPKSYCEVNGIMWSARYEKGGVVGFHNLRNWAQRLAFSVEIQDAGAADLLKSYPAMQALYERDKNAENLSFAETPYGWAVWTGSIYYWLPLAQVKEAISKALASEHLGAKTP